MSKLPTSSEVATRSVGERLAFWRNRAQVSVDEAVRQLGISRSKLWRIESGEQKLPDTLAERMAELYRVERILFRESLEHEPSRSTVKLVIREQDNDVRPRTRIPCFSIKSAILDGALGDPWEIELPTMTPLGKNAYALQIDDPRISPALGIPFRSVFVVDPRLVTKLGDLVANSHAWQIPLVILDRDDEGQLIGRSIMGNVTFGTKISVRSFNKVSFMFTPPIL